MSALRVHRVRLTDPDLGPAWRRLQEAGHVDTPFLSWQWASALRDVPELTADMGVLVCRRGSEVVGLLPLERTRLDGRRVLGIAGWYWVGPDHTDVVAAPADRAEVAAAMLAELARTPGWDVLDLDGLNPDGALAAAVDGAFARPRFVVRPTEELPISYVPLDGEILSNHGRKQVRKEIRRAEAGGGAFSLVTDPDRFPALLERMMDLHVARFGDRSRVFATPARRRFHQIAAARLGDAGLVRVHELRVGPEPADAAAITYTLAWRGALLFYSGGLRTDIGMTPGFSVRAQAMLAAAEDGFGEVDLLRGDHGYKERFRAEVRSDVRRRVARVNAGLVRMVVTRGARALAERAREKASALRREPAQGAAPSGAVSEG
ncbi:GNAT family N-acetyltransferase [Pseudonocardia humida]|uniref:GNAT family N-acetyltransferase n=1 Tax=Pseudonocardia humida TaxID=2800819 RepID=A0ABT1A584_9PSEU|nr:GNAT family N-acetyltransferase [Pseudonocardia humida]MCO1658083.1 GNAT family N-acetyltransferase [Pseudonocardia humida]